MTASEATSRTFHASEGRGDTAPPSTVCWEDACQLHVGAARAPSLSSSRSPSWSTGSVSAPVVHAAGNGPSVRLIAGTDKVTLKRPPGRRAYLDIGAYVASIGGAFEIWASRPDYDTPVSVWQVVRSGSSITKYPLPSWVENDWVGLSRFIHVVVTDADGMTVLDRYHSFCPGSGELARVSDDGPDVADVSAVLRRQPVHARLRLGHRQRMGIERVRLRHERHDQGTRRPLHGDGVHQPRLPEPARHRSHGRDRERGRDGQDHEAVHVPPVLRGEGSLRSEPAARTRPSPRRRHRCRS